jgi:hypothetical protein
MACPGMDDQRPNGFNRSLMTPGSVRLVHFLAASPKRIEV